ncbi:MAG: sigma-54-dependent transcriptional regulator, partial [Spirochaetota bacterium]
MLETRVQPLIMNETILIVDDEEEMCLSLSEILTSRGYRCRYTTDARQVGTLIEKNSIDLAIIDIRMPELDGIGLLRSMRDENVSIPVIMITGYPSIDNAVKAMKYGASNFYVKPLKVRMLLDEIHHIFDSRRKRRVAVEEEKLVTENLRMRDIMKNARKVAPTDA